MSQIAREQYAAYQRDGVENTPFYAVPYADLMAYKGEEQARKLVAMYQKLYANTTCVTEGVLLLSFAKYLRENGN